MHTKRYVILVTIAFSIIAAHFFYVRHILHENVAINEAKEKLTTALLMSEKIGITISRESDDAALISEAKLISSLLNTVPKNLFSEEGRVHIAQAINISNSLNFSLKSISNQNATHEHVKQICSLIEKSIKLSSEDLSMVRENKTFTFEIIEVIITVVSILFVLISLFFHTRPLFIELANKNRKLLNTIYQLQKRNNEIHDFSYLVTHDMQEPLTTINSVISSKKIDPEIAKNVVIKEVNKMNKLLKNLIIYNQNTPSLTEYCNLSENIQGCVQSLRLHKKVIMHIDEDINLKANTSDLRLLFRNIFQNSIDFQRDDVPLKVYVEALHTMNNIVEIKISDNGKGLSILKKENLFEMLETTKTKKDELGYKGIGLSISKKIVENLGGDIDVVSSPNRGFTTIVSLPMN